MALVVYPANLPIPDIAVQGQILLPLAISDMNTIGAFESNRNKTRPYIRATSGYLLEPSEASIFFDFFNNTLNGGVKYFKADWIDYLGIKGYIGRISSFKISLKSYKPVSSLDLEFKPYVQYSIDNPTIPSPWPSKAKA